MAIAISVKSLVLFFMKIILALFFQYNKVKIGNILLEVLWMNVLKKIVSDNRSTEHFDKVIDILMSTGLSEIEAIKLFNMAVRESIPDDDEAGELDYLYEVMKENAR